MKYKRNLGRLAALSFAVVLAGTTPALLAYANDTSQTGESSDTSGMGPGMMYGSRCDGQGMGPGMMHGYGRGGQGMGPGMMYDFRCGGQGMGPGMMHGYGHGGYGMGPGMMQGYGHGGYGMGSGMTYGYGMGRGMMGPFWGHGLDLTDAQRAKINAIREETRKSNWGRIGAMLDQRDQLRDLYAAPKLDDAAIKKAHHKLSELQDQMFDSMLDARKRMEAVLSKEQRDQLRSYRQHGW